MSAPARVLVTGARGFLGRQVVAELLQRFDKTEVVGVSRRSPAPGERSEPALNLVGRSAWLELEGRFDWVLHLAARIPSSHGSSDDEEIYEANVLPSLHLLDACRRWRPSRLIYASSISVYPMGAGPILHENLVPAPNTLYGAAKLAGEHLAALAAPLGTAVAVLRLSSLYGPGQRQGTVLPLFMTNAAAGKPIELVAGGVRIQDFLHVSDAARAIVDAAASQADGVYNLASGTATSMAELARVVTALPGCNVEIVDRGGVETGPSVNVDISKARREWRYAPGITLTKGIGSYHAALLAGVY